MLTRVSENFKDWRYKEKLHFLCMFFFLNILQLVTNWHNAHSSLVRVGQETWGGDKSNTLLPVSEQLIDLRG